MLVTCLVVRQSSAASFREAGRYRSDPNAVEKTAAAAATYFICNALNSRSLFDIPATILISAWRCEKLEETGASEINHSHNMNLCSAACKAGHRH